MTEADYSAFSTAAGGFSGLSASLKGVDVATPFSDVRGAMAASDTEQAALWLGSRLAAALQVYGDDVASLADLATATATNYHETDLVQQDQFSRVTR